MASPKIQRPITSKPACIAAKQFQPDLIVGLGGGSSMDCAKGINFLYSCGGRMQDYWGEGKATGPLLPMIAVPTTAGTGSETQSYALIADAETHVKMACGDKRAAFRVAILDPAAHRHAAAARDRPHRHRCLVARDRNLCHQAPHARFRSPSAAKPGGTLRRISPRVLDEPQNLAARAEMQLGACLAGLAIENSMLGAAHALANPLTATYGIVHGEAVALMLPHVIRHNGQQVGDWYRELVHSAANDRRRVARPNQLPSALADFVAGISRAGRPGWYTYRVRRCARAIAGIGRRGRQAMDRQIQPRGTHGRRFPAAL